MCVPKFSLKKWKKKKKNIYLLKPKSGYKAELIM